MLQILTENIDWDTVDYETAEHLVDVIAAQPSYEDPTTMQGVISSFLGAVRREVDENDKIASSRLIQKSVQSTGRVLKRNSGRRRLQNVDSTANDQIIEDMVHLIQVDIVPGECELFTTDTMNLNTCIYLKEDIETEIETPTDSVDTISATAFIPECRLPNTGSSFLLYTYTLPIDQQQSGYAEDQEKVGYELHISLEDKYSGDEVDGTVVDSPCSDKIQLSIPLLSGFNDQNSNFICRYWDETL